MKFLSAEKIPAEEVGILDNNSEWLGIPKSHLMECAGFSFTNEIINHYKLKSNDKVAIFCGTGNNGGDGFVIARHLAAFGIKSYLILLGTPEQIRTLEARLNWNIISKSLIYSVAIKVAKDSSELRDVINAINKDSTLKLLIDGLLGTGIQGRIREPISSAIEAINKLKRDNQERLNVVSIDVPSGVDPNTGSVPDKAVRADLLITFHRNKIGLKEGSENAREIVVKSIGIPQEANLFVGKGDVLPTLKKRGTNIHKGQFGKVLIVGGSKEYSGAPVYSTLACNHFGVDLVKTYVPEVIGNVIKSYSPSIIARTSPGDYFTIKALEEGLRLAGWADAILIGPGMGVEKGTQDFLIEFLKNLEKTDKPIVFDADALKLLKKDLGLIKNKKIILTPHVGELKALTGMELPSYDAIEDRCTKVMSIAKEVGVTLLVKGPFDYVSNGSTIKINRTGCPEMSMGGTGDVLAGLCAALCSTKNDTFSSACSAAFLNGYIGEFCKKTIGPRFTTSDMISCINNAILDFQN